MRYEFGKKANTNQNYTPEEMHVFEWSTVMLNGIKSAVDYYSSIEDKESNAIDQKIDCTSARQLNYYKDLSSHTVYCAIDIEDSTVQPTYLATYDHDRTLPLRYIEQSVVCEAQMVVSNRDNNQHFKSYEFFRNVDLNSGLFGKTIILKREFEKRIYIQNSSRMDTKMEAYSGVSIHPKFQQIAPASLINSMDAERLSSYMPA